MDNAKTYLGIIGDMNPIEHGGGVVFDNGHGPEVVYFQSWTDDEGTRVSVYEFMVADDVVEELGWVDWASVASCVGVEEEALREYATAPNPIARAQVYESVAAHSGFSELDSQPRHMSLEEAEEEYGAFVDKAHN